MPESYFQRLDRIAREEKASRWKGNPRASTNDLLTNGHSVGPIAYNDTSDRELGRRKNLDQFISIMGKKDLARSAHYRVLITPPQNHPLGQLDTAHGIEDNINMLCEQTSWPDITPDTTPGKVGNEFMYSIVHNISYATAEATFISQQDHYQRKFFENWIDLCFQRKNDGGQGQPSYYNDYVGTMEIFQLRHRFWEGDPETDHTYRVKLFDVYPTTIGSQSLSWSESNTITKCSVTFHYRYYNSYK